MILIICTALNLFGMAYLFYINGKQKEINREFLINVTIMNAVVKMANNKLEDLQDKVEKELENNKK